MIEKNELIFIIAIINAIKNNGCQIISEHTTGESFDETAILLENFIGPFPPAGEKRTLSPKNLK